MKTEVFGMTINYNSWDKKQSLPLYISGNYEIDEAVVSNNRFIVMSPIGDFMLKQYLKFVIPSIVNFPQYLYIYTNKHPVVLSQRVFFYDSFNACTILLTLSI